MRTAVIGALTVVSLADLGAQSPSRLSLGDGARVSRADTTALEAADLAGVSSNGDVVTFDVAARRLTVVRASGQVAIRQSLSAAGSVIAATDMYVDAAGVIFLYEPSRNSIYEFVRGDRQLTLKRTTRIDGFARAFCAIGDRLFVALVDGGRPLHIYAVGGRRLASAGDVVGSNAWTKEAVLNAGAHFACDGASKVAVLSINATPDVQAFDLSGKLKWRMSVPAFQQVAIRSRRDSSVMFDGTVPYDVVQGAHAIAGVIVLQVGRGAGGAPESILLNAGSGTVIATQSDLPLFEATNGGYVLGHKPSQSPLFVFPATIRASAAPPSGKL